MQDDGCGAGCGAGLYQLEPVGDVQQQFVLMLHGRVVDLEGDVKRLQPEPVDARVHLLGAERVADSGAVFVRLRCPAHVEFAAWCAAMMNRLSAVDNTRYDMWCCQHWSLGGGRPYVVEALVQRQGALAVPKVAHAAVDSVDDGVAEACAVVNPKWFAESIRTACVASGKPAALYSWDPEARELVCSQAADEDGTGTQTPGESAAWTLLHGWLAAQTERTDVWHPRALSAGTTSVQLVRALGRLLTD